MQLKKTLRLSLATATSTLLATSAQISHAGASQTEVSATGLLYFEPKGVMVTKPAVKLRREIGDENFLSATLIFDTISGASPNGAVAATTSQTFTSPSGNLYTVAPEEQPTRDFLDRRTALSVDYETPLSRTQRINIGGSFSRETDYAATGVTSSLNWDFNQRLTTLTAALSYSNEQVIPDSGVHTPLENIATSSVIADSETKRVTEWQLGITQIMTARSLFQVTYSQGETSGYQNDPYKMISVINSVTGNPTGAYLYESRPDSRQRESIYGQLIQRINDDTLRVGYRYFWDDWNITSHTVDGYYRFSFADDHYLQPHIRYYQQSRAEFFHYALSNDTPLPNHASADLRLAELSSTTIGLQIGFTLFEGDVVMRLERMLQTGSPQESDRVGALQNLDIHPDLEAYIAQLSYYFEF